MTISCSPAAERHLSERTAGHQSSPSISHGACGAATREERHLSSIGPTGDGAEPEVSLSCDGGLWVRTALTALCASSQVAGRAAGQTPRSRQRLLECCHGAHICRQSPQGERLFHMSLCTLAADAQLQPEWVWSGSKARMKW